jgi:hypothetical protein
MARRAALAGDLRAAAWCVGRLKGVAVVIPAADYLIDQGGIDWPQALASWSWLLPPEFTLWLVKRPRSIKRSATVSSRFVQCVQFV